VEEELVALRLHVPLLWKVLGVGQLAIARYIVTVRNRVRNPKLTWK